MLLTPEEIVALTGYVRSDAQMRALRELGIIAKQRPADGQVLVFREHVEEIMGVTRIKQSVNQAFEIDQSLI